MLEMLESFIQPYSPRLIPAWNGYVQYIESYSKPLMQRYLRAPGRETAGIKLLRYVLACVDWNYMLKTNISDYDKYMYHLRFVQEDLENTFEHTTTGVSYFNYFHDKTLGRVQEFILPVENITPINRLPFDQPWHMWKDIQPVRYLAHNSNELARDVEQDRVKFYKHQPTYAVITIDVVALVMKYMKYVIDVPFDPDLKQSPELIQRIFLHKYVLNGFMRDLTDIFLLKQLAELTQLATTLTTDINLTEDNYTTDLLYGFVGHRFHEASRAVYTQLMSVKDSQLKPRSILSSPLLTESMSPINRANMILDELDIPKLRQYEFYRYLRDRDLYMLIINMFKLSPDNQLYERLARTIKYHVYKVLRNKIWLYIKNDENTKKQIENELLILNESLSFRTNMITNNN